MRDSLRFKGIILFLVSMLFLIFITSGIGLFEGLRIVKHLGLRRVIYNIVRNVRHFVNRLLEGNVLYREEGCINFIWNLNY